MSIGSKIKGVLQGRPGDFPDWLIAGPARRPLPKAMARRGPIVIAGLFRTASGIGQSARACADALAALGIESVNVDLSGVFRQEDMQAEHPLSRMPSNAFGTLILSLNAPETIFALKALRLFWPRRWRVVGQWVWELDRALPVFGQTSKYFTEIWAPSAFSAAAIAPSVDVPVKIVPYYLNIPENIQPKRDELHLRDDEVVILSMADGRSSLTRKNLFGSIRVFNTLLKRHPNCRLILKTRNLSIDPLSKDICAAAREVSQITLIDRSLSSEETLRLIQSCDIYLSLHRAEGFGLVIAEAMRLGKAVVATGWSGNVDFMSGEAAALVPYTLVPVTDTAGVYKQTNGECWAEPDERRAVEILDRLVDDSQLRKRLGAAAQESIQKKLSAENYKRAIQS